MSRELEAFELLCRFLVEEINTLRHKDLNEDYFYNKKYGVFMTDKKTGVKYTTADISDALKRLEKIETTTHSVLREDISKKLTTLEIIIKKEVNVQYFKLSLEQGWTYELCERYCQDNNKWEEYPPYKHSMTREEFDLLKECCYGKEN